MTVPVLIQTTDGRFSASVVGLPDLRCVGSSKDEAIAALQHELAQKVSAGELVNLEVPVMGVSGLAGRFENDPTLLEIRDEIYRQRAVER